MFTGIVEELGTVHAVEDQSGPMGDACRLTIEAATVLDDVHLGDSIAVNGVCLTVAALPPVEALVEERAPASVSKPRLWTADVMQETLDKSSLRGIKPGDRVNLERAVRADQRLGGHIVQGHVDGVGTVVRRTPGERWEIVEIAVPESLRHYLVDKGSITVDGVSLTVVEAPGGDHRDSFTISLIPETLARTTLGHRRTGDRVNLEVDVIAKYVERLLGPHRGGRS